MRSKTVFRVSACVLFWAMLGGILHVGALGCSKAENDPGVAETMEAESPAFSAVEAAAPRQEPLAARQTAPASPPPEIAPDAPTVDAAYPNLASAGLVHAKLADLADGVLLQAEGVILSQEDLDAEIAQASLEAREELRKNAFFILEQMATETLLVQEALKKAPAHTGDKQALLQAYIDELVKGAEVSEGEIAAFYNENRDMLGGQTLERVHEPIRRHLLQSKQQDLLNEHIETLGQRMPIAVSRAWLKAKAELAMDNPVDKARASGKPTFVNFGAKGCVPCDKMEPIREAIREEHEGNLNVVFVHVNEDHMLASRYGVQGIPVLVFFDVEGKEVFRHTGFFPREKIDEQLARLGVR